MSTLKADAVTATTTNGDLALSGNGTGVPDIEAGFKVGSVAGVPTASIRDDAVTLAKLASGTDGELITWDASGDPAAVAVGTATHVLTSNGAGSAPTFQAAAAGGAYTSIANTAITSTANIDFTGFASGTYDNYELWITDAIPATDNAILELETSTDGGTSFDTGGSDYFWSVQASTIATGTNYGNNNDSEIQLTGVNGTGSDIDESASVRLSIFTPAATTHTRFVWMATYSDFGGARYTVQGAATRKSAADVDAIRLHHSSGNFEATGKIQFLGIAQ